MKKVIERLEGSSGSLQLQKEGEHYEIIAGGVFLMSTSGGESEREMVKKAFKYLNNDGEDLRVLIGGLGVGYSVDEAVNNKNVKKIDVVELEEAIIKWNEEYFYKFNGDLLKNKKVNIFCNDILKYLKLFKTNYESKAYCEHYDVVILDVDNGPDWLIREENKNIYQDESFYLIKDILRPGGILVIWSATINTMLSKNLSNCFEESFLYTTDLNDEKGRKFNNYLYFGRKGI